MNVIIVDTESHFVARFFSVSTRAWQHAMLSSDRGVLTAPKLKQEAQLSPRDRAMRRVS